ITLALIDLLERETAFSEESYRKPGVPLGEAHCEFYGNVVEAVVSLRDTRSISALIGAIETGNMVARALAEFGDAALDRLLQVSNSSDDRRRFAATFVLGRMLES